MKKQAKNQSYDPWYLKIFLYFKCKFKNQFYSSVKQKKIQKLLTPVHGFYF